MGVWINNIIYGATSSAAWESKDHFRTQSFCAKVSKNPTFPLALRRHSQTSTILNQLLGYESVLARVGRINNNNNPISINLRVQGLSHPTTTFTPTENTQLLDNDL